MTSFGLVNPGPDWWLKPLAPSINTLRPRKNGRHFPDDIFKYIFLNENIWIWIMISLKFVPKGSINNIPELVQIMAWCRPGDMPLSEPMMDNLPTHICVTQPQWVNTDTSTGSGTASIFMDIIGIRHLRKPSQHNTHAISSLIPRWHSTHISPQLSRVNLDNNRAN